MAARINCGTISRATGAVASAPDLTDEQLDRMAEAICRALLRNALPVIAGSTTGGDD